MTNQDKPTAEQIKKAAESAQLSISAEDAKRLENGENVKLEESGNMMTAAAGGCSGIKLVDLGGGCGLYLNPFPPSVSVCCQT
jgi:hypothetical protein